MTKSTLIPFVSQSAIAMPSTFVFFSCFTVSLTSFAKLSVRVRAGAGLVERRAGDVRARAIQKNSLEQRRESTDAEQNRGA